MSVTATAGDNPFAALADQVDTTDREWSADAADAAEDEFGIGFDPDDADDSDAAEDGEASPAAALAELTEDELFDKVFNEPQLDLLSNIVDLARGWQLGSPWGALGKAVGVAACDVPHTSFASGTGSTRVPLNFLLGMVGDPGMGKGATMGAPIVPLSHKAAAAVQTATSQSGVPPMANGTSKPYGLPTIRRVFPASGPAFVAEFFDTEMIENEKGKAVPTAVRHQDPVWAEWNEVDSLTAKSRGVSGSTLDPIIRSVFTGEDVGDKSLSRSKDGVGMIVESGTYRAVVVVGIQPERAAAVIRDGGGGTLQRYIFLAIADDAAPPVDELFRIRCRLHRRLGLPAPANLLTEPPELVVHGPSEVSVSDDVIMALLGTRRAVLTRDGSVAKEDTHATNNRLRLAAIYAGWKNAPGSSVVIDMEAWGWAGAVMEYSRRRRAEINATIQTGEVTEARRKGELWGVSKAASDAHAEQVNRLKVDGLVLTIVEKLTRRPGQSWREIQQGASKKQRDFLSAALDLALLGGQVVVENGAHFAVVDGVVQK